MKIEGKVIDLSQKAGSNGPFVKFKVAEKDGTKNLTWFDMTMDKCGMRVGDLVAANYFDTQSADGKYTYHNVDNKVANPVMVTGVSGESFVEPVKEETIVDRKEQRGRAMKEALELLKENAEAYKEVIALGYDNEFVGKFLISALIGSDRRDR